MFTHRFSDLLEASSPVVAPSIETSYTGIACPVAPALVSFVQEVYRLALESAQAQLRPRRSHLPSFSLN
jgi:hypothetical protein